jgi:hypothetical protein
VEASQGATATILEALRPFLSQAQP